MLGGKMKKILYTFLTSCLVLGAFSVKAADLPQQVAITKAEKALKTCKDRLIATEKNIDKAAPGGLSGFIKGSRTTNKQLKDQLEDIKGRFLRPLETDLQSQKKVVESSLDVRTGIKPDYVRFDRIIADYSGTCTTKLNEIDARMR